MRTALAIITFLIATHAWADLAPKPSKTESGRFQLIQLSSMRRDQFLLDTQTGKIWQQVCFPEPKDPAADQSRCASGEYWSLLIIEGVTMSYENIVKIRNQIQGQIDEKSKTPASEANSRVGEGAKKLPGM